jgi:hypothetical protein
VAQHSCHPRGRRCGVDRDPVVLNAAMQVALPAWVRARGTAAYILAFMGAQAVGSTVWDSKTLIPLRDLRVFVDQAAEDLPAGDACGLGCPPRRGEVLVRFAGAIGGGGAGCSAGCIR